MFIFGHLRQWKFAPRVFFCQSRLNMLPNINQILLPKILNFRQSGEWRNFVKSGPTDLDPHFIT